MTEKALGPDHPDTAIDLNNLGYLLQDMGDLAAARPFYERALAIWEAATLGLTTPDTATSLNNLGGLLYAMGDLVLARPFYERALAYLGKSAWPNPTTQVVRRNLAYISPRHKPLPPAPHKHVVLSAEHVVLSAENVV
ncbi:MAG: tetratricopeptide repeat protein [Chloroflexota bacterium]